MILILVYKLQIIYSMNVDFTELNKITGVTDTALYGKGGELVAPQLPYTPARILQLGKEVALFAVFLSRMKEDFDFIEFIYGNKRVIVRLAQNFFLVVISENTADVSLIKLTLNVIQKDIKGDRDLQKIIGKSAVKRDLLDEAAEDSELQDLLARMKITA
jgi:hypothetical protein